MTACCRRYLREYVGRMGVGACSCRREYYHVVPGVAKSWPVGSRVYVRGEYVGTHDQYGDLRKLVSGRSAA